MINAIKNFFKGYVDFQDVQVAQITGGFGW